MTDPLFHEKGIVTENRSDSINQGETAELFGEPAGEPPRNLSLSNRPQLCYRYSRHSVRLAKQDIHDDRGLAPPCEKMRGYLSGTDPT